MENKEACLDVASIVGTDTLLGKIMGQSHFPTLLGAILQTSQDTIVYLDFGGIINITASYIAATIVQLLRLVASGSLGRYLVIGGIHQDLQDEIEYVLAKEGTPILVRTAQGISVAGPLDKSYARTLAAVAEHRTATAKELKQRSSESLGLTGWIKRLTTLHKHGLLARTRNGREYTYETITLKDQEN
ncbi:MAG TPA: hypothetical protein VHW45_20155 [Candidatus Sulfotelmatobacter sp.]|jgi:hypothetical protein|nr:hypothetical protein [Candidatus Sulfotelmatobacter sp.]